MAAASAKGPRCPNCHRHIVEDAARELKANEVLRDDRTHRPFCSARCKMVDLGKWLGEEFVLTRS